MGEALIARSSSPSVASPTSQLIPQPFCPFTYVTAHSPTLPSTILPSLQLHHSSFYNPSGASSTSQLILQQFPLFTYGTAHFPTLPSLHLCNISFDKTSVASHTSSSFYNPSVASPTLQLILKTSITSPMSQLTFQPFRCFTYVSAHSPTLPSLHRRHSSFDKPFVTSPTSRSLYNPSVASAPSQLILQPFHCFTYVTAHFPILPSLHLCHRSFSNLSVASPTSQLF